MAIFVCLEISFHALKICQRLNPQLFKLSTQLSHENGMLCCYIKMGGWASSKVKWPNTMFIRNAICISCSSKLYCKQICYCFRWVSSYSLPSWPSSSTHSPAFRGSWQSQIRLGKILLRLLQTINIKKQYLILTKGLCIFYHCRSENIRLRAVGWKIQLVSSDVQDGWLDSKYKMFEYIFLTRITFHVGSSWARSENLENMISYVVFLTSSLGATLSWEIECSGLELLAPASQKEILKNAAQFETYQVASSAVVLEFDTLVGRNVVRNQKIPEAVLLFHPFWLFGVKEATFL